jgi:acyl transferase domain-containing protein/acyl-CoA synthetase (AMP-forming)/AMP-acid ligase II/aryl carrier-like protein
MGSYPESIDRHPSIVQTEQFSEATISERLSICEGATVPEELFALTLPDLLRRAAQSTTGILWIQPDGTEQFQSYSVLLDRSQRVLQGLRELGLQPHDPVVLQLSQPQEFLAGFWGCVLGGFVPVPIAVPPSYTPDNGKANTLRYAVQLLERATVLTHQAFKGAIGDFWGSNSQLEIPPIPLDKGGDAGRGMEYERIVAIESLLLNEPDTQHYRADLDRLALVLLTSGSTGNPKGVMLTARNLLASVYGMATVNGLSVDSITLNWMPLEHVASLVMFHLTEVFVGCEQIHAPIERILQEPLHWLELIDRYRVTTTWAPNFAYGLVNDRAEEIAQRSWDLSCVQWMGNGAEAVVGKTTRRFLERLLPHGLSQTAVSPGYGMSETCSGIIHSHDFSLATTSDSDAFVEVGTPIPGVAIRIVDEQNQLVTEGTIGLLQVRGLTVTSGYYQRPDLNAEIFTEDGWFNTGDLGFLRHDRLTITGRQKEVIIINGANYYNHEIEAIVEELPDVVISYTAACAVRRDGDTTDRLAIFFSPASSDQAVSDLLRQIRGTVAHRLGVSPDYLIPVSPSEIPKTAIGKIQRSQLVQRFQAGEFDQILNEIGILGKARSIPAAVPQTELEQQLVSIWQDVLGLEQVGTQDNFFELGGNSLRLMQVLHRLQQAGHALLAIDLFQHPTIAALAKHISRSSQTEAVKLQPRQRQTENTGIAVIGMAGRFPGADSIDRFWQNLCDGVESISFFSDAEILAAGIDPALLQHPQYVKASPILSDIETFDAEFFGYSAKEAEVMDPQQRLLLECAWESLEDAGYNPFTYAGAIGLYAGASMNTYLLNQVYPNRHRLDENDLLQVVTLSSMGGLQMTIGNDKDYLTTRVSYKLNLTGPSVNVQTACSTSLVAIHLAAQSLLNGECDMALAGGVSVHTPQKVGHLYQEGLILSPDGHCRAFDARAQGTIFGSGVGLVVLKRLEEAIEDGDHIYAVIKGSAIGNDGSTKVGYLAPRAAGQATVAATALSIANIDPATVTYVEAHGTGTELGDPIEIAGLTQAFRLGTQQTQFCAIGSVKTNVGHLNIASGVVGFIKTVLALHHKKLPPSLHFETPNPQIDFANSPFYVNTTLSEWQSEHPRRAGVNSLGIGGTNVHVVLEEFEGGRQKVEGRGQKVEGRGQKAEGRRQEAGGRRQEAGAWQVLALSAKNEAALRQLAERYERFLTMHSTVSLADLCFTANTGRSHFQHRLALVANSVQGLRQQLAECCAGHIPAIEPSLTQPHPKIAFLFTGQGSQYLHMGHELYETQPVFQAAIDRCTNLLKTEGHYPQPQTNNSSLIRSADAHGGSPHPSSFPSSSLIPHPSSLTKTASVQPALFAIEYALAELWRSWGITPTVVMGHSVGEYVAACVAGVFSLEDGLKLVAARGRLMQGLPTGGMVSVFANSAHVEATIAPYNNVAIAAINGSEHTVISGPNEDLQTIVADLETQDIKTRSLSVSHAFHSPMMQPMLAEFEQVARTVQYAPPQIDLISNVTGERITDAIATPEYWVRHICQPVQFAASLNTLQNLGCEIAIECGPKPVLIGMARSQLDCPSISWLPSLHPDRSDWQQLLHSLAYLYQRGLAIDWQQVYQGDFYQRLSLPTYPFQRQRYWLDTPSLQPPTPNPQSLIPNPHPLLGNRLPAALKSIVFQSHLSATTPAWLADHRVYGQAIVPATAYLEMALAAGKTILKTDVILEQVKIQQALLLSDAQAKTVQLIVAKTEKGATFEIYSLIAEEQPDDWVLHASGTIVKQKIESVSHFLRIEGLRSNQSPPTLEDLGGEQEYDLQQLTEIRSPETHYQFCQAQGLDYGTYFQGIEQLWRKDGEALGQVQLPPALMSDRSTYQFHPALLDACFQVVLAALPTAAQTETYVPISLDRLQLHRSPTSTLWSHVQIRSIANLSSSVVADVTIWDEAGNLVAQVEGLAAQRTCREALLGTSALVWHDWLYEVEWQRVEGRGQRVEGRGQKVDDRALPGTWLIFADTTGIAEELQVHLEAQQQTCMMVYSDDGFEQSDRSFFVNPTESGDYQRLLSVVLNDVRDDRPLRGVIHFWSILPCKEEYPLNKTIQRSCQSALYLTQALINAELPQPPRLWLVTRGAQIIESNDRPLSALGQSPLWGLGRTIALEHPELHCTQIDLDPNLTNVPELVDEILNNDEYENQIAFHQGDRFVARLVQHQLNSITQSNSQRNSETDSLQLEIVDRGTLDSLVWRSVSRRSPQAGEVEIRVYASGLNFRDVLNALGLYPGAEKLGLECAGEIVAIGSNVADLKVGDAVVAIAPGSFSQYVTVDARLVALKPEALSFAAAATIPTAFLTADYTLRQLAKLAPGDRVLIHAAAGGVGLAAIQMAQQIGAEIFATASPSKWEFLRSIGVKHLMNSRTLDFADDIMAITQGQGVDVVLNCLTGEFIPQSLAVLRANGRFVEIGKQDVWSAAQVAQIRPDVSYFLVDLMQVTQQQPDVVRSILHSVMNQFHAQHLQPLPLTSFPSEKAIDAFRTMQQAKHIGKLVITPPQPIQICQNGTYLITGGLGDLGLQVAQWLVSKGATHLLLLGRNAPSPSAQTTIRQLEAAGATITIAQADVANLEQLQQTLQPYLTNPQPPTPNPQCPTPLKGIIHAAGLIDDRTLQQQTWEQFDRVLAPKIQGAWNLHLLTQNQPIDCFVLFSSAASLLGSAGQANYAAANAFLDALAQARRAIGLPGLSINWGAWSEIGLAARSPKSQRSVPLNMASIAPAQGLEILDYLVSQPVAQVGVLPINLSEARDSGSVPAALTAFLSGILSPSSQSTSDPPFLQVIEMAPVDDRPRLLADHVRVQVANVLGMEPSLLDDPQQGFSELGMDSLTSVELRNRLQTSLGCSLSSTLLFDYPTLAALTDHLSDRLGQSAKDHSPVSHTTPTLDLIEVQQLSEAEAEALLLNELDRLQD